jgi:hypothetical protein
MNRGSQPNRGSGNWLPGVEKCPTRAKPCGNPLDADQAMRAGQIEVAGRGSFLSGIQTGQAMKSAESIARKCTVPAGECPLEKKFGGDRVEALGMVKNSVK